MSKSCFYCKNHVFLNGRDRCLVDDEIIPESFVKTEHGCKKFVKDKMIEDKPRKKREADRQMSLDLKWE